MEETPQFNPTLTNRIINQGMTYLSHIYLDSMVGGGIYELTQGRTKEGLALITLGVGLQPIPIALDYANKQMVLGQTVPGRIKWHMINTIYRGIKKLTHKKTSK